MAESIGFASCVRGYHVYQEIWTPSEGETLICSRETSNREDPFVWNTKYDKKGYRLSIAQYAIFEFTVSDLRVHG